MKKLLTGEIEDPVFYSSSVFASLDNEAWEEIQMQLSSSSSGDDADDTSNSESGSSDEEMA